MLVLAIRIERPNDVAVQRPQHPDTRMHQWPAAFSGHQKHTDSGLPFRELLIGLWKFGDVLACIEQSQQLAPVG